MLHHRAVDHCRMANVLADFPADRFDIVAFCHCGHQAVLDLSRIPPGLSIDPGSGLITGIMSYFASAGSPYTVTITVADDGGSSCRSGSVPPFASQGPPLGRGR